MSCPVAKIAHETVVFKQMSLQICVPGVPKNYPLKNLAIFHNYRDKLLKILHTGYPFN